MMITADRLKLEELRLRYLELINRPEVFPTRANWRFITSNRMHGLAMALYGKYLTAITIDEVDRQDLHDVAIEEFPEYLKAIDRREAVAAVYSDFVTAPDRTVSLIHEAALFDADSIAELIDEGHTDIALRLISAYQSEYTDDDLEAMRRLAKLLDTFPVHGGIFEHKGLFGTSPKYICPAGHVNPPDAQYCTHTGCGLDSRGLTHEQEDNIELLTRRICALQNLINEHEDK